MGGCTSSAQSECHPEGMWFSPLEAEHHMLQHLKALSAHRGNAVQSCISPGTLNTFSTWGEISLFFLQHEMAFEVDFQAPDSPPSCVWPELFSGGREETLLIE